MWEDHKKKKNRNRKKPKTKQKPWSQQKFSIFSQKARKKMQSSKTENFQTIMTLLQSYTIAKPCPTLAKVEWGM